MIRSRYSSFRPGLKRKGAFFVSNPALPDKDVMPDSERARHQTPGLLTTPFSRPLFWPGSANIEFMFPGQGLLPVYALPESDQTGFGTADFRMAAIIDALPPGPEHNAQFYKSGCFRQAFTGIITNSCTTTTRKGNRDE